MLERAAHRLAEGTRSPRAQAAAQRGGSPIKHVDQENLSPLAGRIREKLYSSSPSREASMTPGVGSRSRRSPSRNRSPSLVTRSPSQEAKINRSMQKSLSLRQRLQEGTGAITPRQKLESGRAATAPRATSARREKGALLRRLAARVDN